MTSYPRFWQLVSLNRSRLLPPTREIRAVRSVPWRERRSTRRPQRCLVGTHGVIRTLPLLAGKETSEVACTTVGSTQFRRFGRSSRRQASDVRIAREAYSSAIAYSQAECTQKRTFAAETREYSSDSAYSPAECTQIRNFGRAGAGGAWWRCQAPGPGRTETTQNWPKGA